MNKIAIAAGIGLIGYIAYSTGMLGGEGGSGGKAKPRFGEMLQRQSGGILGTGTGAGAPTIYNLPAQAGVVFPAAPDYSGILSFLQPQRPAPVETKKESITTGSSGVSGAYKRVVASGFDVSSTITGTPTSPAFVQKDIYHKAMLKEVGLSKKTEKTTSGRTTRAGGYGTPSYHKSKIAKKQARLRAAKGDK